MSKRNQEKLPEEFLSVRGLHPSGVQQVLGADPTKEEIRDALLLAAERNHVEDARLLLVDHGADVNSANESSETALFVAVDHRNMAVAKLLLEHNADANKATSDGTFPIHRAASHGCCELVKLLLDHNARVDQQNQKGERALILAIRRGHINTAKLLVEHEADVNAAGVFGTCAPALHEAIKIRNVKIVNMLLEVGADANVLHDHFRRGEPQGSLNLVGQLWYDRENRDEMAKLLLYEMAKLLLKYGGNCQQMLIPFVAHVMLEHFPDALRRPNMYGRLPLHLASRYCSSRHTNLIFKDIVRRLVEGFPGALQHSDNEGDLPLHHFARYCNENDTSTIHLLIDGFPDALTHRGKDGKLPLHHVCALIQTDDVIQEDVIRFMVERYPRALVQGDRFGRLPLHHACASVCSSDVIRLMVDTSPEALKHSDGGGNLPLNLACSGMNSNLGMEVWLYMIQKFPDAAFHQNRKGEFPFTTILDVFRESSVMEWIKSGAPPSNRTILALKELLKDSSDEHKEKLKSWDDHVAALWFAYFKEDGTEGRPPRIADTYNLSDHEFRDQYKWMVYATCSGLFMLGDVCLLKDLFRMFTPDVALDVDERTGLTPLLTALKQFPPRNPKILERGLVGLIDFNPIACRIRNPNGRLPVAFAVEADLSWRVIKKMLKAWPVLVDVDGSFWWEVAARSSCKLSNIYNLLRMSPDTLRACVVKASQR